MKVFVYGTLKPGSSFYQQYCAASVQAYSRAIARGQLFALPAGYPAMTPGEGWVQGFLLQCRDEQMLTWLDDYEDYHPARSPQENLYERQLIEVFDPLPTSLGLAWAYMMTSKQVQLLGGQWLPKGEWP